MQGMGMADLNEDSESVLSLKDPKDDKAKTKKKEGPVSYTLELHTTKFRICVNMHFIYS